ncbi:MAG: tetratricopeptide repeat protein [Candidatus Aminicenantes bacterium]|nr:tetratricopeptide repeat protein [Candidatus Aminicenantes bacterium]
MRRPQPIAGLQTKKKWPLHEPLKLLLVSAAPKDQTRLHVENELLKAAYALEEPMANRRVIVDEVLNCTREKLGEILRCNVDSGYDILYFTGHGHFDGQDGYLILEKGDGAADPVSANDVVTLLRRQRETFSLVFLNCCNAAAVGDEETTGKNGFGDVARKILKMGVPHVVATQASIYDDTGREAMKTFFEELGQGVFNPIRALVSARAAVDNDANPYHDFYHFVHLSTWTGNETWEIRPRPKEEGVRLTEEEQAAYRSEHYIELDKNFVGRFEYISRIEEAWWNESAHVVGLHGLGGIGKTYLCSRMQQRVLTYAVPAKRLNKCIFIDFRQGTGHTLGLFLNQLIGIAHDLGFSEYEKVVEDDEKFPTALEKLREFRRWLDSRFQGKVLLIMDNLESALDEEGIFRDEELGKWFRLLVGQTSKATRILVTCRFRFEFFPDGRDIVEGRWFHLGELGITERLCFLNRWADLRSKTWEEKEEILQTAGGHPYLLKMVLKYVQRNRDLPEAILKASKETAAYARLDGFLSMLSPDALEWLIVAAVFPEPRFEYGIMNTLIIRDDVEDAEVMEKTFAQATEEWTKLSLAAVEENVIHMDPLLVFQLLDNEESSFRQTGEKIEDLRNAVGQFFLILAKQTEGRPQKATILRLGVENVLTQGDMDLINSYLQECANVFHGFVPGSVFADMVGRVEERLFAMGDELSFFTLGFCAETLTGMRLFSRALALYSRMLADSRMPETYIGNCYNSIGIVYQKQRQWEPALENYQQALQWYEKTGNHFELGGTYHQIGRVYEEQRQWEPALENYQQAFQWNEKTGNHFQLGSTFHQIGYIYAEQRQWDLALENYQQALQWYEKTGNHFQLGGTYHLIGRVYQEQRQWDPALENYQQAIQWNEKTGNHFQLGGTYHQIGRIYEEQRQWDPALENYQQALQWNEKTGNHFELGGTYHQIGRVYEEQEDITNALSFYKTGLLISLQNGNQDHANVILESLACIFPKLSPEQIETLENELGEELVQKLKESSAS